MKERKLNIIIALMTIAVLGLIGVQLYWITSIIKIQQEKFAANVNDALNDAINKIELTETKLLTLENLNFNDDNFFFWNDNDSGKTVTGRNKTKKLFSFNDFDNIDFDIKADTLGNISIRSSVKRDSVSREVIITKDENEYSIISRLDSLAAKKAKLVSNVVNQFIVTSFDRTIEERLDKSVVDSILNFQLNQKGIDAEYNFGVLKKKEDVFAIVKDSVDTEDLKRTEFRAQLFPDEMFGDPNLLMIYFPNQKSYIIQSVSLMLALSALMIITIIILFFKTVQMLVRQKKITEIKNDLINNITHEFKTPISTISLACEALVEPQFIGSEEKISRYTGMIKEENSRLQLLVDTLLRNAAIEKGEYQLDFKPVDIHDEITNASNKFHELIEKASGSLTLNLQAENSTALVDKLHFNNIITNLLDNAFKYSQEKPIIVLSTQNAGGNLIITVEDSGIGIEKNNQNKIFETFYRVPKGNIHDVKGYGIGLSYVKRMTAAMNGSILVKSKLGHGSKFILSFPLSD